MTPTSNESLPPWCTRMVSELRDADARAKKLVEPLSPEQLNWKASANEWSVGQCLEHLLLANETYLRPISDALTKPATGAVQEITPGWFGRWFIRSYIEPSPQTRRARAPGKIVPGSHVDATMLDRFLRSNEQVRQVACRAANHDVNRIRFSNPYFALVRFTIGTGLLILPAHERRHLLQAERIRASAAFPSR